MVEPGVQAHVNVHNGNNEWRCKPLKWHKDKTTLTRILSYTPDLIFVRDADRNIVL
ncbi:MAG TPA: hypothetical protein VK436_13325 [Methanocella sp.]|nr:hypothetical protein [Methanocella sp.]